MKKRGMKRFFKPTWLKILVFVLLVIIFSILAGLIFLKYSPPPVTCVALGCHAPSTLQRLVHSELFSFLLVLVAICSYLVSCFVAKLFKSRRITK